MWTSKVANATSPAAADNDWSQAGDDSSGVRPTQRPSVSELYDEHVDFVFRNAIRMGLDEAQAEDVVQEVFVVVHQKLAEFEARANIRTWIYGILRNIALREAQKSRRRWFGLRNSSAPGVQVARESQVCPAGRSEDAQLLYKLLEEIDAEKRDVFLLAELEEMTTEEIAEALGIKHNTAKSRLRAAREGLQKAYRQYRLLEQGRIA